MIDLTHLSSDYLMKQAGWTANDYMLKAVKSLDEKLYPGYADSHPEALAGFMQTCASDFHTSMMIQVSDLIQAVLEQRDDDDAEDEHFNEGYAKSNAALIGRVLQAGLIDYFVRMFSCRYGQRELDEQYILGGLSASYRLKMYKAWKKVYRRENPKAAQEEYDQAEKMIIDAVGV